MYLRIALKMRRRKALQGDDHCSKGETPHQGLQLPFLQRPFCLGVRDGGPEFASFSGQWTTIATVSNPIPKNSTVVTIRSFLLLTFRPSKGREDIELVAK